MKAQKRLESVSGERLLSLENGLRVLELFGAGGQQAFAMIEVADQLGITRAAALRILATLEGMGYMRLDGRLYTLTPRVLSLGYSYLVSLGFSALARPILQDLAAAANETCSIGVLDGGDVVYVARVETRRFVRLDLNVGSRLPAHLSSMGRVMLSSLPDAALDDLLRAIELEKVTARSVVDKAELRARIVAVRKTGYCVISGEIEDRISGMAAPIKGRDGAVVAALNISLSDGRYKPADIKKSVLPLLLDGVARLEAILLSDVAIG